MIRAFVKFVPNLLSLMNATFGVLAIMLVLGNIGTILLPISVLLLGSIPCDMLDGFAARKLDAKSPIGVDLDSLADVISFGVAPAVILATALQGAGSSFPMMAVLIVPFSVYRLAKFNHDTRQTKSFLGLPTPANAVYIFGWSVFLTENDSLSSLGRFIFYTGSSGVVSDPVAFVNILVLCFLLVSEVPMFGIKSFGSWKPVYKVLLGICLVLSGLLLALWGYKAFMIIVGAYILFNLLETTLGRPGKRAAV